MITVDTNAGEDCLFELLSERAPGGTTFVRRRLDVGDVHLDGPRFDLAIERKTLADLCGSISSGRFEQQRSRMLSVSAEDEKPVRYIVMVEGSPPPFNSMRVIPHSHVTGKAVHSSLLRTQMYGISVVWARDCVSFAEQILHMHQKLTTNEYEVRLTPQVTGVHKRKRDNADLTATLEAQLTCVQGISEAKAKALIKIYPCWSALCAASAQDLADVKCGGKKLGPVVAARLRSVC